MSSKIKFNTFGSGKPLVLIHPLGLDSHIWDFCIEEISKTRFIMTYDLPGHGNSSLPKESYQIKDLSLDLYESLKEHKIDQIDCLGLSIGGMILQDLASNHQGFIDRLILVDTTYKYTPEWKENWSTRAAIARNEGLEKMIDQFLPAFFSEAFLIQNNEAIDYCRRTLLRMNGEAYAKACEALSACNLENEVDQIRSETLILCGDQDNILFKDAAVWLENEIQNSKLSWLKDAQHLSPLEKQDEFIDKVLEFLND